MRTRSIQHILHTWGHDGEDVVVRLVDGADGRPKLQMRVLLGLLQMELDGRPDGQRPEGCASLLEFHLDRIERLRRHGGRADAFRLTAEECSQLRSEAGLYYRRYLACFNLGRHADVVRDTARNLQVCDLVRQHAPNEDEVWAMEQFRPYIVMMNGLARAELGVRRYDYAGAERVLELAIAGVRAFGVAHPERVSVTNEVNVLLQRLAELRADMPTTEIGRAQRQLDDAVAREDYEAAVVLRDRLEQLAADTLPSFWD